MRKGFEVTIAPNEKNMMDEERYQPMVYR